MSEPVTQQEYDDYWARIGKEYERDYILPCFGWAKEIGFDLHAAVQDNPGHNCVELLVSRLRAQVAERDNLVRLGRAALAYAAIDTTNGRRLTRQESDAEAIVRQEYRSALQGAVPTAGESHE